MLATLLNTVLRKINGKYVPHPRTFVAVQTYVQHIDILLLDVESYEEIVKSGFELSFWQGAAKKNQKLHIFL